MPSSYHQALGCGSLHGTPPTAAVLQIRRCCVGRHAYFHSLRSNASHCRNWWSCSAQGSNSASNGGSHTLSEGVRSSRSTPRAPGAVPPRPASELTVSSAGVALRDLWEDAASSSSVRAIHTATDQSSSVTTTSARTETELQMQQAAAKGCGVATSPDLEAGLGWRRRWTMVLLCFAAFMLCNMDRVNMSVAILPMSQHYHWQPQTMGLVQSSFFWGYLCTQVLGGVWAAKYGGKLVLGLGVAWWSLATAITPTAASLGLPTLMAARALMGLGEGVAMPAMNQLLSRWVPSTERSRSLALVYSGMFLGSMTGLTISPQVINMFGWPAVFVSFGSLGAVWLAVWISRASASPFSDPLCSAQEKEFIAAHTMGRDSLDIHSQHHDNNNGSSTVSARSNGSAAAVSDATHGAATTAVSADDEGSISIPWGKLLARKEVWAIILCHFCHNWGTFILLTWMPSYYHQALGLDLASSGMLSCLPWATMAVMANVGGWLADMAVGRGASITTVRRVMQTIGFLGPAFFLGQLSHVNTAVGAVICMMGAQGCDAFSQSGLYSNHQDIAPRYAGVLLGLSNTAGVLAGVLGSLATGFILQHGTWDQVWQVAIALYLVGTAIWNTWSTGEKVID